MPFLLPNQQRQGTEGTKLHINNNNNNNNHNNVFSAILMTKVIAKAHFVYLMNAD